MPGGPPRKPDNLRQRRNKRPELAVVEGGRLTRPGAPEGVLPSTVALWDSFWDESELATFLQPTDLPAITRLFIYYDEWTRAHKTVTYTPRQPIQRRGETNQMFAIRVTQYQRDLKLSSRVVPGAQGQPMLNPLIKRMDALEKEITQLEDRFGFNLAARQRMGLNQLKAKTLHDQNELLRHAGEADRNDDPVAALLQSRPNPRRTAASERR